MYLAILKSILAGEDHGYSRNGYYLAASGSVAWDDIYASFAKALAKRDIVDNDTVVMVDDSAFEKVEAALGWTKEITRLQLGGRSVQ